MGRLPIRWIHDTLQRHGDSVLVRQSENQSFQAICYRHFTGPAVVITIEPLLIISYNSFSGENTAKIEVYHLLRGLTSG